MKITSMKSLWIAVKKSPFETAVIGFLMVAIGFSTVPQDVFANEMDTTVFVERALALEVSAMQNDLREYGALPENDVRGPVRTYENIAVTAYNSVPGQTDATPCIGAQGTDICVLLEAGLDTCAANFVPLGTMLHVEGLGTCEVRDRMNARYTYRVDWYMGMDIQGAKSWGVKYLDIGVYAS